MGAIRSTARFESWPSGFRDRDAKKQLVWLSPPIQLDSTVRNQPSG